MALIKCPECGRKISDEAKDCPFCGYPIALHYDELHVEEPSGPGRGATEGEQYFFNMVNLSGVIAILVIVVMVIYRSFINPI